MANLNFKKGEYSHAALNKFTDGDIVVARLLQPRKSELGFGENATGCLPRAEGLFLKTIDYNDPSGNYVPCLSPIMPSPGIGFLTGTGMQVRPIYTMPSFNTIMSNDGLILNMALQAHDGVTDSAESFAFGTAFADFDVGLIPAASETQTGVVTIANQYFKGIKTFESIHTDYGLVLTGKGIADGSTSWSSAITFKRKDNDKVIGSWMMYSTQKSVDNVNKISTAQPIFRCYSYEGKYVDIRMPICTVDSLSASTNKYLAYINAETLPTKNMIPYFSAGGSNALLRTSGHYIDLTRLGINIDSIPTTDTTLYVNGNSIFTGTILPQSDRAQNIGSLTQSFNAIYAKALYLKGDNSKTNYIVGSDPTDNDYYAKLPNHSGNITISNDSHFNSSDGITCYIPFYSTRGQVIQYNNGLRYFTIEGTDTTTGNGMLVLGNSLSTNPTENKRGSLRLYGPNNIYTTIMAANLTANRSVYIRDYGVDTTYFVGVNNVNGKGNDTTPIYIANNGLATACNGVIVTSGEQTFSGDKTFSDNIFLGGSNRDEFIYFLHESNDTTADWRIGYLGSGTDDNNCFVIQSSPSTSGSSNKWTDVIKLGINTHNATFANNITAKSLHLTSMTDAKGDSGNTTPALTIGNKTGEHILIDSNEILAKTNASTIGTLYLNHEDPGKTVTWHLTTQGNLIAQSNVTLGSASTDTITINGAISGNITPLSTANYNLGEDNLRWKDAYIAGRVNCGCLVIGQKDVDNCTWNGYGEGDPTGVTAVKGRVYFKIIN